MWVGVLPVKAGRLTSFMIFQSLALCAVLSFFVPTSLSARQIQVGGQPYVDLVTVGKSFGMQPYWLKGYKTFRLRSQSTTIDIGKNGPMLYLHPLPLYLGFPTLESNAQLFIAPAASKQMLQPLLTPQAIQERTGLRRTSADAGPGR